MPKKTDNPIISDEFLDRVVTEINEQYGGPAKEKNDQHHKRDREERS
ncbi:bacitracin ABC transporter ATP-binding protein [Peribacillus butanolivorans]